MPYYERTGMISHRHPFYGFGQNPTLLVNPAPTAEQQASQQAALAKSQAQVDEYLALINAAHNKFPDYAHIMIKPGDVQGASRNYNVFGIKFDSLQDPAVKCDISIPDPVGNTVGPVCISDMSKLILLHTAKDLDELKSFLSGSGSLVVPALILVGAVAIFWLTLRK